MWRGRKIYQFPRRFQPVRPACSPRAMPRRTRIWQGFHADFKGPFQVPTPQGFLYLLILVDDYSKRIFPHLVKSTEEWFETWRSFVARIEAELGTSTAISWLLTDYGTTFRSAIMASFCFQKGIQQRFAAPGAQWMDGTSERTIRTVGDMSLTTLIHSGLPKSMWGYAALHAVEVKNRSAESAKSNKKQGFSQNPSFSRLERWRNVCLPDQTKGLYPFGCLAFKFIYPEHRGKLDAHTSPHVFLGLDAKTRCYKLGTLFELNISVAVEVSFVEEVFPFRFSKPASAYHHLWSTESRLREGEQDFDISLSQNPIYSPSTTGELLKDMGMVPPQFGSKPFTIAGDSSLAKTPAARKPRKSLSRAARGPKIGHIDPDSAPHAGILAKKRATRLQNEREEQFSQPRRHHPHVFEKLPSGRGRVNWVLRE